MGELDEDGQKDEWEGRTKPKRSIMREEDEEENTKERVGEEK